MPRTSAIWLYLDCKSASPDAMCSPIAAALPARSFSMMYLVEAYAAAHVRALPPNVEPWSPGSNAHASSLAMNAPIGTPPPSPFASDMMSGSTPKLS